MTVINSLFNAVFLQDILRDKKRNPEVSFRISFFVTLHLFEIDRKPSMGMSFFASALSTGPCTGPFQTGAPPHKP